MSVVDKQSVPLQTDSTEFDIQIKGLTKTFGDTNVVDNLTLNIPKGQFLGLIGANGAGKSTTLRMLVGMLEPTSGTAKILDTSIKNFSHRTLRQIGYVPDNLQIYRWMTVKQAIQFCKRLNPRWDDETSTSLMKLFHLDPKKKVKSLSKGMLGKLNLLLAISIRPEILILDEPMSGLDPIAREEFLDGVLKSLSDRKCTVVLSSHSIEDVQRMSDSIAILHNGRLLLHEETDLILEQTRRVQFVVDSPEKVPQISNLIWSRLENREFNGTIRLIDSLQIEKLKYNQHIRNLIVSRVGLEEIYKDYIKGSSQKGSNNE